MKGEIKMEQIYNGMLPLGLSQRLNEPVMMLEKGEQAKPQLLAEPSPMIVYDKDYGGYLGYGYNVIAKRYYNSLDLSLGALILSREPAAKAPLRIRVDEGTYVETTNIAALYAEEYSQKVSAKAGLGVQSGAFKASFNMAFTTENKVSSSKSFATRRHKLTLKREYFDLGEITAEDLRAAYLTPDFRKDVNNDGMSAEELFTKYGTHLLLDIRLGGRMEMDFMHEKSSNETEQSLTASLEASYMAVSGNASSEYKKTAKAFFDSSTFHCVLLGGAVSTNIATMEQAQIAYDTWIKSLDPTLTSKPSLAFIGTGSLDNPVSVLPVWMLADSPNRQAALKAGFATLLAKNGGYFKNLQDKVLPAYMKDIFVGYGDTPDAARADVYAQMAAYDPQAPEFIVFKDLNCSARGKYEYLGYTVTTDLKEAIRGMRGATDPNDRCSDTYNVGGCTYHRLRRDLNHGAGGHYVYLYWTKDAAAGKPLLAADVEINYSGFDHYGQPGWSRVRLINNDGDLNTNRGTGSRTYDIFVWVSKEL